MDKSKLKIYGWIPLCMVGSMVAMYFCGIEPLQQIIMPEIEGMYGSSKREFGLLENAQNVLLMIMIGICIKGFKIKPEVLWKVALTGLACFTLLVFLEEIDYGLHYIELIRGVKAEDAVDIRNFHNAAEGRTNTIKQIVDLGMTIFFVVLPFVFRKSENKWIRHFTADRYSVVTLLCAVLVSKTAHFLNDMSWGLIPDNNNTSEFRELFTYYLCMLYYWEVIVKRKWGVTDDGNTEVEVVVGDEEVEA